MSHTGSAGGLAADQFGLRRQGSQCVFGEGDGVVVDLLQFRQVLTDERLGLESVDDLFGAFGQRCQQRGRDREVGVGDLAQFFRGESRAQFFDLGGQFDGQGGEFALGLLERRQRGGQRLVEGGLRGIDSLGDAFGEVLARLGDPFLRRLDTLGDLCLGLLGGGLTALTKIVEQGRHLTQRCRQRVVRHDRNSSIRLCGW